MKLLRISTYPAVFVFIIAGLSAVIVAFASYNLLHLGMANLRFIREHGSLAVQSGALLQILHLLALGAVALFFFILFKICESDLVKRYEKWSRR